ncbi:MAG: cation:proton antiporter, partial [Rickettsiales bacterium]|nr:cation:proton antiporter [Rickettsiales bacterium]
MFTLNLIPLQVLVPLLLSPLCAAINHSRIAWGIAALATLVSFGVSVVILAQVGTSGESISYAMGGWEPPFGIEYRINSFNALLLFLVTGVASILMPFAYSTVRAEIDERKHALFYTVYLLCFAGLLGISVTNDVFNIYVFLEISSLATYTLIAIGRNRKALTAAFEYLILGSIGATFYLIGIGLLYMATGTLNFTDLSARIAASPYDAPVITGFAFIAVGLLLKVALFPLHSWLCQAYTYAPTFVSAFLSATATKVSLYVLIRILYELFGRDFEFTSALTLERIVRSSLYPLSLITIIAGSYMAMYMHDIKKSLAYSSVAQIGYIM